MALSCAQPFTYQGFLRQGGSPANGNYTMTFRIYDALTGGTLLWNSGAVTVNVNNGLFTVQLNAPASVWSGADRFLEIQVGSTTLSPRVQITPTPYAFFAQRAPWSGITGVPSGFADGVDNELTLPFTGSANVSGSVFTVANDSTVSGAVGLHGIISSTNPGSLSAAVRGQNNGTGGYGIGVWGSHNGSGWGVYGTTVSGVGVYGLTTATSGLTYGVYGQSDSTDGTGVYGLATATSGDTVGVFGASYGTSGTGVVGWAYATSGYTIGVYGRSDSTDGTGVFGIATASGVTSGVYGRSYSTSGYGVFGWASATSGVTYGVYGRSNSTSGYGMYGYAAATSGVTSGVSGESASTSGRGVVGLAYATSGITFGVYGKSASTSGLGVYGYATATSGSTVGVYGRSDSTDGMGVSGLAYATSGSTVGVYGRSDSTNGIGVYGVATATSGLNYGVFGVSASPSGYGVYGRTHDGRGVFGIALATSGATYGVYGRSNSTSGYGMYGYAAATSGLNYGVLGESASASGYGVYATGRLAASGAKLFQIDHPLRPETHFLNHFCTEGPEPYNAYSGNVVTDAQGYATVQLPDYFETINRDFRYQLTVIDNSDEFVLVKVVREIQNNQFVIRTSKPYVKVSWEVKAIRHDRWVQEYGYQTEQEKPKEYQGRYLHPELYGQPKERGIFYRPETETPQKNQQP
jgi:hypothetical protein